MNETRLTPEQIHAVLTRAQEIELRSRTGIESATDIETLVAAAQEVGVSRDAITQAVKEHQALLGEPPKVGDFVFAKSADGKFYAAEIAQWGEVTIRVRFLNGGDSNVAAADIRPLSLTPGSRLICPWPEWGWWTCSVISYNAQNRRVKVTDNWGTEKWFDLADVRLPVQDPTKNAQAKNKETNKWVATAMTFASGGLVGAALTWLLTRH